MPVDNSSSGSSSDDGDDDDDNEHFKLDAKMFYSLHATRSFHDDANTLSDTVTNLRCEENRMHTRFVTMYAITRNIFR